jgi:hypothetical protein
MDKPCRAARKRKLALSLSSRLRMVMLLMTHSLKMIAVIAVIAL